MVLLAKFYDMALIYTRTTGETILLWAALHNREATFKSLLERGADMLIHDKDGDTVLHHLATKGNLHLLTLLLQHPQLKDSHKIDIRNDRGETPLSRQETKRLWTSFYMPAQTHRLRLPLDLRVRPVDESS